MNILFLTISDLNNIKQTGLYMDLVRTLINKGNFVYVVSPYQKRDEKETEILNFDNCKILKVETGNITRNKSFIEKGWSTLRIEKQYLDAIKKYYTDIRFDMIIYSTPPITFNNVIKYIKNRDNCKSYLMLKDIFPQNAVDLGIMNKNSLVTKYFRNKEKQLYKISDYIGCMSEGNIRYVLENNRDTDQNKVELFPNAIVPIDYCELKRNKDYKLLEKYKIPNDKILFIYGGNLGRPQGIDFLIEVIKNFYKVKNGHLLVVGNGSEFNKLEEIVKNEICSNVKLFNRLPKVDYDKLLKNMDIGFVFLDYRFTIPNIPSRILSYMEMGMPIIAATDKNTDLQDIINEARCGYWCESRKENIDIFINYCNQLSSDLKSIEILGENSRRYLDANYDIRDTINIMLKHFE